MMNSETRAELPESEVGGYLIRPRRTDTWDAIVTLLVTLESEHVHYFHAVMQGCRRLSNSTPEDGRSRPSAARTGAASPRRRRRTGAATIAPGLRHCGGCPRVPANGATAATDARGPSATNPIATAYFRAVEEPETTAADTTAAGTSAGAPDATDSPEAILELLADAGLLPEQPRALLGAAEEDPRARNSRSCGG